MAKAVDDSVPQVIEFSRKARKKPRKQNLIDDLREPLTESAAAKCESERGPRHFQCRKDRERVEREGRKGGLPSRLIARWN